MIILITGATHTGKTKLAQRLLETLRFPYLSIDHLKMGLIRSGNTHLTAEDDEKLTEYLWPIVCEIIKTAIENGQNLIIEGGYIPFEWRKYFQGSYIRNIRCICLGMTDRYIEKHFEDIKTHSFDIESRADNTCTLDLLKIENQFYIDGCRKSGEKLILINDNYEKTINGTILDFLREIRRDNMNDDALNSENREI